MVVSNLFKRRIRSEQADYFDFATLLELAVLDEDESSAIDLLQKGVPRILSRAVLGVKPHSRRGPAGSGGLSGVYGIILFHRSSTSFLSGGPMEVITISDVAEDGTPRPIFEGRTTVQPLVTQEMAKNLGLVMVNFSPGARTKLHIHTHDQVLLVTSGKGILATEAVENVVTPGMLVHVPPGERHWHGATQDSSFSHVSITSPGETQIVE